MQPISPDRMSPNRWYDTLVNWYKVLRGQISFGDGTKQDNIRGQWVSGITPGVANTEFTINHGLGSIPTGIIVVYQNLAGSFYNAVTPWTKTQIFLQCSTASVTYRIFIIGA